MTSIRFYSILSVFIISLVSLIWVFTLWIKTEKLKKIVIYLVSFSAWWLLWDAFLHLLPEIVEENWFTLQISFFILLWIIFGLITEKIIHRNHCHMPITKDHVHHFAYMNLIWDIVHNFIDWLIIWASFLVSIPFWIATSIAVLLHEIPQEIWDFGVLIHWWFTKKKALIINFLVALTSIIWVIIALSLYKYSHQLTYFLIPFAAWSFIYIASTDLIPELHKQNKTKESLLQILFFLIWIWLMSLLMFLE